LSFGEALPEIWITSSSKTGSFGKVITSEDLVDADNDMTYWKGSWRDVEGSA
jgi:hypothetical protein